MIRPRPRRKTGIRLRTSVSMLLVGVILVTLLVVGSGLLAFLVPRTAEDNRALVGQAATEMAERVEVFLENVEARVNLAGDLYQDLHPEELPALLDRARRPNLGALYIIDADGRLLAASIEGYSDARLAELRGIDLSTYPFFRAAARSATPLWSDKQISAVTGAVTVGLSAPAGDTGSVIIAEMAMETLLRISRVASESSGLGYWILDSKGELVADTDPRGSEAVNLYGQEIVAAGLEGRRLPETMRFGGATYNVSAAYSPQLGWLFVSRIPAGLQNPRLREIIGILLAVVVGSVLVGLLLAPLWAQRVARPIRQVAESASRIARGAAPADWPGSGIAELNQLSSDLATMWSAISRREEDLRHLNEELESRVARRTAELQQSNRELSQALITVEQAKDELIQSERLAALGRMVAGIAHELNTPLGNGRIAVSALADRLARFEASLAEGLRRSELDAFIASVRTSSGIAEHNLRRAADLVGSFKQVAADRTASRRRKFQLREAVDEVFLTISPTMKHLHVSLSAHVPEFLWLDSYPGELGQALTNLIENAVAHGFKDRAHGSVAVTADLDERDQIVLEVRDDGCGMTEDVARKAFDPFFTTALGQGGTGLGLFITHNAVTNVLGGTISLHSRPGAGTVFELRIPRVAPAPEAKEGHAKVPPPAEMPTRQG